jgi:hypothetical protein
MELLNTLSYFNQLVGEKMADGGLLSLLYFVLKSSAPLCGYSSAFCFFEKVVLLWSIGTKDG